ncbi:hypothetical protein UFOVP267_12 [uncultured Caudovirales phage]|uniref:Uncharacterized protein n=1 Tax=uncultured Caudovirales phage TaxID=2100421 RepID=A0A6J5LHG1_9CAUD|nr:hypothetical protein UFOVP267_12 [uncultured Caudovirales phage]
MPDEVLELIRGGASSASASQQKGASTSADKKKPEEEDEVLNLIQGNTSVPAAQTQAPPPTQTASVKGIKDRILGGLQEFGATTASLADTTLGAGGPLLGYATQGIVRPFTSPEQAQSIGQQTTAMFDKPFGKLFGVTDDPAYKAEITQRVMNFIGENVGKSADWIYQNQKSIGLNLPKADIEHMMTSLSFVAPGAAGKVISPVIKPIVAEAKLAGSAIKQGVQAVTPKPIQNAVGATVEAIAPGTTAYKPSKIGGLTPEQLQAQFEARGGNLKQNADQLNQNYEQQRASTNEAQSVQQPILDANGQVIGQADLGTAKPTRIDSEYKPVEYAESGLPLDEQFARAKAIERVFGADYAADLAALEGKGKERATNYQASKSDTPLGNYLAEKFKDEQRRLQAFADQQAQRTGGIVGLDESAKFKRGEAILDPLKKLEDYFDTETRKIYKERDTQAATIPVEANNILNILNDESLTLANTETIGLSNIAKARMRQLKMMDKDGNLLPTDAKTAENFRQFLNENYDRKNANLHRALKTAVDEDVLANMDTNSPIYKDARSLVELRKNTLDNPKGISAILDESGPNNINRRVDKEKISQNIANMSVEQFTHVIDTLKNMPPELQVAGNQALANIKSQFASNIAALADKPKQLTKFMNDNREVMPRLFNAEEMSNFRDLHNVAHILKTDTGYPGAAVQKINIEQKLLGKIGQQVLQKGVALSAGGAAEGLTGGLTGGTAGGTAALITNELIGRKLEKSHAAKVTKAEAEAFKNAQSRFVPIRELINK